MNKTKIVATIGPSSSDKEILRKMYYAGMNVVRINLSHADYDFCKDIIKKIDEINEEEGSFIAIMLDLKGPDLRVDTFSGGSAFLKKDDKIRIYNKKILGDSTKFSISCPTLVKDIKKGAIIKLDDGKLELQVEAKGSDYLICKVLNEGFIKDKKSCNIPGVHISYSYLSDKDIEDIKFASKMKADFLALSFVSSHEDILAVNDLLIEIDDDHIELIAKIENKNALEDLDEIINLSDGVMVARGDLGVEVPMETVPGIQKRIIDRCHALGKVSIVATEMLSSMENVLRPTRAEVSDVANAVLDGVDAVMLSGETTIGKYPVATIDMMARIAVSAEEDINYLEFLENAMRTEKQDTTGIISYSVAESASRLGCKAIIASTRTGYTARKMSRFRPQAPIIAMSPNIKTLKALQLHFGIKGALIKEEKEFENIVKAAKKISKEKLELEKFDKILITGGYPVSVRSKTNFMLVEEI
jgi:pyruvate kinase